jgi:hypothetical protein
MNQYGVFEYIGKITGMKAVAIAEHKRIPTGNSVAATGLSALQRKELNYSHLQEQLPLPDCHKRSLLAVVFTS